MKRTDIGKGRYHDQGGQEYHKQIVHTPKGPVEISGFVEVPRLTANKRTWKIWFERFIDRIKYLEIRNTIIGEFNSGKIRISKWKNRKDIK